MKGRAPKTGYAHSEFGVAWTDANTVTWGGDSLSTREGMLSRDLLDVMCKGRSGVAPPVHVPQSGVLRDRYTRTALNFVRGETTSLLVSTEYVGAAITKRWDKHLRNNLDKTSVTGDETK